MMHQDILSDLTRSLRVTRRRKTAITRELQSHLQDVREDLIRSGWSPGDAAREAAARLGDPTDLAREFSGVYRPSRRGRLGMALVLASGMLLGAYGIGGSLASATAVHKHVTHTTRHARAVDHRGSPLHVRSAGNLPHRIASSQGRTGTKACPYEGVR
jgi:hypothetical protein